jgi:hypothetical protein
MPGLQNVKFMGHNFMNYLCGYVFRHHGVTIMLAFGAYYKKISHCGSKVSLLTNIGTITVFL